MNEASAARNVGHVVDHGRNTVAQVKEGVLVVPLLVGAL